jgi:sodium transport system ATP-binding protein
MIEITNLKRNFGKTEVLKGISLKAEPGKVTGLLGPNGAGKTTTIKILSTILKPHGGDIIVNGHSVIKEPALVRKNLGVVFEESGIYQRLTGEENILYFADLADVPPDVAKERMYKFFELLGVDYAKKLAGTYSKGMMQKINLIRAIIHNPPVVVLDEPTNGLDVPSTRAVETFIREMKDEGKTILLSTHLMAQVEKLCDYIYIIHKGRIVEEGTPQSIKEKYDTATVEDAFLKVVSSDVA